MQSSTKQRLLTTTIVVAIAAIVATPVALLTGVVVFNYSVGPSEIAESHETSLVDGTSFVIGGRVLVNSDIATYEISHDGYQTETVQFDKQSNQRALHVDLVPLPGYLDVVVSQEFPVSVTIGGVLQNTLQNVELPSGSHVVSIWQGQSQLTSAAIEIEGFGKRQEIAFDLTQFQATLSVSAEPATATIELNDEPLGRGSFSGGIPAGGGVLRIAHPGYQLKSVDVSAKQGENVSLGTIVLEPALITVSIKTTPSGASILLNGEFRGESDKSLRLRPEASYQLVVRKPGYREHRAVLQPAIGENLTQNIDFEQETIEVAATSVPPGDLFVNGIARGQSPLTLTVYPGDYIEARAAGLVAQGMRVASDRGPRQSITFELLPPAEHAYRFAPETTKTTGGLELVRFPPVHFQKTIDFATGETTTIDITRPFYLSATEVTTDAFKLFKPTTDGTAGLPVTRVSWVDAARFCNWLSTQAALDPVYAISFDGILESVDRTALGFRLPSEAEWETGASFDWRAQRVIEPYEWGVMKSTPLAFGNLAGSELSKTRTRFLESFTDNHESIAPVGSYRPNVNGLYDMTGNVSEWVHDYHEPIRVKNGGPDFLGPSVGFVNVVKGASFETDELHELATHYRRADSGRNADIGFRVARWIY